MFTDANGRAQFLVSDTMEGSRKVSGGPLLSGKEIPQKHVDTKAANPNIVFVLPKTRTINFEAKVGDEGLKVGTYVSWYADEPTLFAFHTGGQFMPLATKSIKIGGFLPDKHVQWKLTTPGRCVREEIIHMTAKIDSVSLTQGDLLSSFRVRIVDPDGNPYPSGLLCVRASKARNPEKPRSGITVMKQFLAYETGVVEATMDLSKRLDLDIVIRRGVAGDFKKSHSWMIRLPYKPFEPGELRDFGDVVVEMPGQPIDGIVVDAKGNPKAGVLVEWQTRRRNWAKSKGKPEYYYAATTEIRTNDKGRFRFFMGEPRTYKFGLQAKHKKIKTDTVEISEDKHEYRLVLPEVNEPDSSDKTAQKLTQIRKL